MGYADGYFYGQTRFIINTDAMSAGDTVRVRSMTDSNKVWNKNVTATGTPLVFDVPCKDYYKICTVQDISDVPTEIGGVYKDGNYGFSYYINVLDKTTLGGIQGILNAYQESSLLNIGDEVNVTENGVLVPYLVTAINLYSSHQVFLSRKNVWTYAQFRASASSDAKYVDSSNLRTVVQSYYNILSETDKAFIKYRENIPSESGGSYPWNSYNDYIWLPTRKEVFNSYCTGTTPPIPQIQFPLFATAVGRMKKNDNGDASNWWTSTVQGTNGITATTGGDLNTPSQTSNNWILPHFMLTADS